jgi:hypothetical protein
MLRAGKQAEHLRRIEVQRASELQSTYAWLRLVSYFTLIIPALTPKDQDAVNRMFEDKMMMMTTTRAYLASPTMFLDGKG